LVSLAIHRLNRSDIEPPKVPEAISDLQWLYRRFPGLYRTARLSGMWRFDLELPYQDFSQRKMWIGPPFVKELYDRNIPGFDFSTMLGAQASSKSALETTFAITSASCGAFASIDGGKGHPPALQHSFLLRVGRHSSSQMALMMPFEVVWEESLNKSAVEERSQVTFEIQRFMQSAQAGSRHVATFTIGSQTQPLQNWNALEEIIPPGHSLSISVLLDPTVFGRQVASVSIADEASMLIHFRIGLDNASVREELLPSVYTSAVTFRVQSRKVVGCLNSPIHDESYSVPILPISLSITGLVSTDTVAICIDDEIVRIDSLLPHQLSNSGTHTLHSGVNLAEYSTGLHTFRAEAFDLNATRVMFVEALFYKMTSPKATPDFGASSLATDMYSTNRIIGDFGYTFRFDGTCLTSDLELLYFAGGDVVYDFPPLAPEESLSLEVSCETKRQWAPVVVGRNSARWPLSRPVWPSPRTLVMLRPSVWKHGQSQGRLIVSDLLGLFSVMRDLHEDTVDVLLIDTFPGQTKSAPEVVENFALFHASGGEVWLLSNIWEDMHTYFRLSPGLLCPRTLVPPLQPLATSEFTLSSCA
jgi:hypothetical protein